MGDVWTDEAKYNSWLQVEIAAAEAMGYYGYIPKKVAKDLKSKAKVNIKRILQIEKVTQHDVIAFLTQIGEKVGSSSKYVHYGMTSSDVLDTALALQIQQSAKILKKQLERFIRATKKQAKKHKKTVTIGRSHGVHAEPTTFGLKMATFYEEARRNLKRLEVASENIRYGQISGAVGTFANVEPKVEAYICKKLNLKPEPISTQIIQRDRHAEFLTTLAVIGGSLERLALEIRLLQKTENSEAGEQFKKGQKGSSAMPHKRNPIYCERMAGMSRLLRGNALAAMENQALWHERDISHSSVERVILPDSTIILDYMLDKMSLVVENLFVDKKRMIENMEQSQGRIFSQGFLLKLVSKGLSREDAYKVVQGAAMKSWEEKSDFRVEARKNKQVTKYLTEKEINNIFSYDYHTKHVDKIFRRIGIK